MAAKSPNTIAAPSWRKALSRIAAASQLPAFSRIAAKHPGTIQLLLSDLLMPRMSGHELALALRNVRTSLRVVFVSGYTDDELRHNIEDPDVGFLQKPFTPALLAASVRSTLDAPQKPDR